MGPVLFFIFLTFLTGIFYPLAVTAVVRLVFPEQSGGSLITRRGELVGSELIAQPFKNPKYFWSRPAKNSASGLDPHITLEMARSQIPRIAGARMISEASLEALITRDQKGLVNVLLANLELDR